MNNRLSELTKLKLDTSRKARKKFGIGLTGIALACLALASVSLAQTSIVCDPAGDPVFGNGRGGPQVPARLDVTRSTISDSGENIVFTLTINAPVPAIPAWSGTEEGGQFWWGWRFT